MEITIASWNINSIRKRIDQLKILKESYNTQVICLQETKVSDEEFPIDEIKKLGFTNIAYKGNKGYNGVAILSTLPFTVLEYKNFLKGHARDLAIKISNIEIHNIYAPAGGYEPNINTNPKFKEKLDFFDSLNKWTQKNINSVTDNVIFLGDLNIAPLEEDVWSHIQLLKEVSHTPVEIEAMTNWYNSNNLIDAPRVFVSKDIKLYSWWSYRNKDYKKSNRGRRLDHLFITNKLLQNLKKCFYAPKFRNHPNPSDHVPLIGIFDI